MPPQGNPRAAIEVSLDIAASPQVLWATFADLDKWPRWSPDIQSVRWASGTVWTLGAQLELTLDLPLPARRWSGTATITEMQPAVSVAWETVYPLDVTVIHSYRFKPSGPGTVLSIREAYYGNAVLFYRLSRFPGQRQKTFETALKNLKAYLQGGS
jgi:hypothetical protein